MPNKLDPKLVAQTLKGYQIVNQITWEERRQRLKSMTAKESLAIFASLYETWQRTGQQAGGDWGKINQSRLEQKIKLRKTFATLARAKGLL